MHNVKFTILNILNLQLSGLKNIHIVVQLTITTVCLQNFLIFPHKNSVCIKHYLPSPWKPPFYFLSL